MKYTIFEHYFLKKRLKKLQNKEKSIIFAPENKKILG